MKTSDPSDTDVIARILDGESDMYRLLMKRYTSLVFHVVGKYENDESTVKEMSHEIFIKAYEQLPSFENRSAFSSWLYRLAYNHCIDHVRKKQHRNRLFSEMPEEFDADMTNSEPDPDSDMENNEKLSLLHQALEKINDSYSTPLLMKYRDGMSYEAISKTLNVPEGALKVRVHRARKELKQAMEQSL